MCARRHGARALAQRPRARHALDERRRARGGVQVARPPGLRAPRARAARRGRARDRRAGTSLEVGRDERHAWSISSPATPSARGAAPSACAASRVEHATARAPRRASLEYRAPLLLASRGIGLLPFFLDRTSLTLFGDWGIAACASDPLYATTCVPPPRIGMPIASAGAELGSRRRSWSGTRPTVRDRARGAGGRTRAGRGGEGDAVSGVRALVLSTRRQALRRRTGSRSKGRPNHGDRPSGTGV